MPRLTEMPNDRYKSLMVANAEKQTRLLAIIAANSEALDGRIDQLQSRCNQILARVAETGERVAEPGKPESCLMLPDLIGGGGDSADHSFRDAVKSVALGELQRTRESQVNNGR